jgi:DNA primase
VFDARGLLGYEARLQADIRVTILPPGMDPDDVVNRDPTEWERILAVARPVVVHVMDTLAAGRDLTDPKVKTEVAAQVLPLIEDVPSPVERDTYRQRLARLLKVDERSLVGEIRPRSRRRPGATARSPLAPVTPALPTRLRDPGAAVEAHCLGVFLRRPDLLYLVDRRLMEHGLTRLAMDDFASSDHQAIFHLIQRSLEQDDAEPLDHVMNRLDLPLMDICDDLLGRTERLDPNPDRVLEDLMRSVLGIRRRNLHLNIDHLRYLMEEAQGSSDPAVGEFCQIMVQYTQAQQRLDRAYGRYTSRIAAR